MVMKNHDDGFWQPKKPGYCWVCGMPTTWAWLDQAYQHPDCDAYPSPEGDVVIIRGKRWGKPPLKADDP